VTDGRTSCLILTSCHRHSPRYAYASRGNKRGHNSLACLAAPLSRISDLFAVSYIDISRITAVRARTCSPSSPQSQSLSVSLCPSVRLSRCRHMANLYVRQRSRGPQWPPVPRFDTTAVTSAYPYRTMSSCHLAPLPRASFSSQNCSLLLWPKTLSFVNVRYI